MSRNSESHPIQVDFVDEDLLPGGQLGLTFAPGKVQPNPMSGEAWNRDIDADLRRIRSHYGAHILVGLIEDHEFRELDILALPETANDMAIDYRRFPVPDFGTPEDVAGFYQLIDELVDELDAQKTIVVHCKGGLGRAGTLAASVLVRAGVLPEVAITAVRGTRPGAIENSAQESFVYELARRT
jgi:protein-tyrosine phosphatase